MEPAREVTPGESVLTIAVWMDDVRLIDNLVL
jgi:pantothenate synthetase